MPELVFAERECKISQAGYDYVGSKTTSKYNNTCLRWDLFPEMEEYDFHDALSFSQRGNQCRSPSLDGQLSTKNGPWCIVDNNRTVEECDIPTCGK